MSSNVNKIYKCPFCDARMTRADLVEHISDKHDDDLPEDFTAFRYVFHYVNKKPLTYHGICTECKGPTPWDESRGRYKRQCGKKACHDSFVKKFEANMVKTRGVTRISATTDGQLKMLQNRKISGKYKFQNGVERSYCGNYELHALEFMDQVLNIDPADLLSPGPILEYKFHGKTRIYITDFYYQPYNLIIEVKDGGSNPNMRNMPEYRAKQIEKEKYIIKHTNYNYLRLTDNNLKQLINIFAELRLQMNENTGERVIHVNESDEVKEMMSMVSYAPVIGLKQNNQCVYVRNYMQNNAFSGWTLSDNYKFDRYVRIDDDEKLVSETKLPDDCVFDNEVLCIFTNKEEVTKKIKDAIGTKVDGRFFYETLFNKKQYTEDQFYTESNAFRMPSFDISMKILSSVIENYVLKDMLVSFDENNIESLLKSVQLVRSKDHKIASEHFGLGDDAVGFILDQLEVYYGQV